MVVYVALSVSLISLGLLTIGLWLYHRSNQNTIRHLKSQHEGAVSLLSNQLKESWKTNQDLLNRMMAADLPSYTAMTQSSFARNSEGFAPEPYISRSDEAEAMRLAAEGAGLGYAVYDQEFIETMQELHGLQPEDDKL